jgi:SAM-dependent methyltransferase
MSADLSLVVPVYNEEMRLPGTLARLAVFASDEALSLEVIVADDGSTDRTAAVFKEWVDRHASTRLQCSLVQIAHRGKGAAVRAGMQRVTAPIVGYTDADLSAGPDAILQLLAAIARGADIAIASRGLPESILARRQPWYREMAGRTLNVGLRKLTGIPFRDTQCGLKLFRAHAAREVFRHQRIDGFAFDVELVMIAMKAGFTIDEIPVTWVHEAGSKLSLFRDPLPMARDILRTRRRFRHGIQAPGVPSHDAMETMTGNEDSHWWHVAKRRIVSAEIPAIAPQRCLDIGCGGGAMLLEASKKGGAVGTDLSTIALKSARARGLRALVRAEGASLPLASRSFSAVLALDVIEHHAQPEVLLGEIARVLVPGGRLIVTVPAYQWMWSYADDVLGHYRRYTRSRLKDELRSAGFDVRRVTYFHSWLLPIAWTFRTLRTLLGRTGAADDFQVHPTLNRILLGVCSIETRYSRRANLPFGLSVLAIAERREPVRA